MGTIFRRILLQDNSYISIENYLTIVALENGLTAKLSHNACQYCIDGDGNWIDLPSYTTTQSINYGQTLSFRGNLTPNSSSGIGTFTINKRCNIEGNCMSLLFGDDAMNNYSLYRKICAFKYLFRNCTTIIQVSEIFLPATTLSKDCYRNMFDGCTGLTTAPELPSTTLSSYCYSSMFHGCSSLTQAPELPATTLAEKCYYSMFEGCSSLTQAPELPATTLAGRCYDRMFNNCSKLTTAPELPATTLSDSCYYAMFSWCSSLTTAPALPATTLAIGCYQSMFSGCSKLTTAPELPATTLSDSCYYAMFSSTNVLPDCSNIDFTSNNVVSSGGLKGLFDGTKVTDNDLYNILPINPSTGKYWLPSTALSSGCYKMMFSGCSKLTTAPELPATTLADDCYYMMFFNCSNLNYIKMLATDISASECLDNWVYNVSSTGTFVKNQSMTSLPTGSNGIPSGWTVVDDTGSGNEEVLPESTEFGFPLYLNTAVTYDEGYYQERRRTGDKILEDFYQWFEDNKVVGGSTGDQEIPAELLEANPIYIDGNRVVSIHMSAFGHNIEFENNMYNDKSIYTLEFSFSATELSMYIYFDA